MLQVYDMNNSTIMGNRIVQGPRYMFDPEKRNGEFCFLCTYQGRETIWGRERFNYFLYGKEFTLETDQEPLVSIYKKHMIDISPRVHRLIVRSFPYQPFTVT